MSKKDKSAALLRAIEKMGTGEALAAALKITPQAVALWRNVPLARVFQIEKVTGIPRSELRPDFFGSNAGENGECSSLNSG